MIPSSLISLLSSADLFPNPLGVGAFVRFTASQPASRLVFPVGEMKISRFMACLRYDPFWMIPEAGVRLGQTPAETQSLLVKMDDSTCVILIHQQFELHATLGKALQSLAHQIVRDILVKSVPRTPAELIQKGGQELLDAQAYAAQACGHTAGGSGHQGVRILPGGNEETHHRANNHLRIACFCYQFQAVFP